MGKNEAAYTDERKGIRCITEQELENFKEVGGDKVAYSALHVIFLAPYPIGERFAQEHRNERKNDKDKDISGIHDMCAEKLGFDTYLITDTIVNRENKDYSQYKNGSFEDFYEFLKKQF